MSDPEVFVGLDVGKATHHCVALAQAGQRLIDRPLTNDEQSLRELFTQLAVHSEVVVVVDQPARIGRYRWRWSRTWAWTRPICRGWRCAGSRTCIPERLRPMPGTRS